MPSIYRSLSAKASWSSATRETSSVSWPWIRARWWPRWTAVDQWGQRQTEQQGIAAKSLARGGVVPDTNDGSEPPVSGAKHDPRPMLRVRL